MRSGRSRVNQAPVVGRSAAFVGRAHALTFLVPFACVPRVDFIGEADPTAMSVEKKGRGNMAMLDWMLILGVLVFGVLLSVRVNERYKVSHLDFLATTAYVASLAALIVAAYHALRSLYLA